MSKLIYLASPYSHRSPFIVKHRTLLIANVAGELIKRGFLVYSPICHCHPIKEVSTLNGDWEQWKHHNREMMNRCDELWIVSLNGWRESTGIKAEIEYMQSINKPILFLAPDYTIHKYDPTL